VAKEIQKGQKSFTIKSKEPQAHTFHKSSVYYEFSSKPKYINKMESHKMGLIPPQIKTFVLKCK